MSPDRLDATFAAARREREGVVVPARARERRGELHAGQPDGRSPIESAISLPPGRSRPRSCGRANAARVGHHRGGTTPARARPARRRDPCAGLRRQPPRDARRPFVTPRDRSDRARARSPRGARGTRATGRQALREHHPRHRLLDGDPTHEDMEDKPRYVHALVAGRGLERSLALGDHVADRHAAGRPPMPPSRSTGSPSSARQARYQPCSACIDDRSLLKHLAHREASVRLPREVALDGPWLLL